MQIKIYQKLVNELGGKFEGAEDFIKSRLKELCVYMCVYIYMYLYIYIYIIYIYIYIYICCVYSLATYTV